LKRSNFYIFARDVALFYGHMNQQKKSSESVGKGVTLDDKTRRDQFCQEEEFPSDPEGSLAREEMIELARLY
jgi:hypothetical protein